MQYDETNLGELVKTLTDSFNILADEVQLLCDRKTILEHKLRFAHEQYQYLADKHAPSNSEISNTLAKLQLPPELKLSPSERVTFVPLPSRRPAGSQQQAAEAIRDGRKASQRIATFLGWKSTSETSLISTTGISDSFTKKSRFDASITTVFEQDFTVPGKKSQLLCPLAPMTDKPGLAVLDAKTPPAFGTGHDPDHPFAATSPKIPIHSHLSDPICAALRPETHPSPPPSVTGSAAKCPIRFLDQHSPEDVAKYFESHKHEIPRSHEICVKRYQRNEEDIRKLDAKYGSLVSMISGLGQKHQPILQLKDGEQGEHEHSISNERVHSWAKAVSVETLGATDAAVRPANKVEDRQGHFDRPLREIRVGESPSRPWGFSVPFVDKTYAEIEQPGGPELIVEENEGITNAQPFKHTGKCPFNHKQDFNERSKPETIPRSLETEARPLQGNPAQPTFIHHPEVKNTAGSSGPQMIFTGPVFIGYPVEQAMALMQQWQAGAMANKES